MQLRTLGSLELEGSTFTQPQPLLLLAYLCSEGKTSRQTLAELFWPEQPDSEKRSKSLHTVLKKLSALGVAAVTLHSAEATLPWDVQEFSELCLLGDRKILGLYKGPFLHRLEASGRLRLGEAAQTWLLEKREHLHEQWLQALLEVAEADSDQNNLKSATALAWRAFKDSQKVNYPEEKTLRRFYGLLLEAGQKRKAEKVKEEAEREYGVKWAQVVKLPEGAKPFVGREQERKELRRLLSQEGSHLITLTGLGGVGKTELALAVAKDLRYQVARVAFVPLEPFTSATNELTMLTKIATSLGLELANRFTAEAVAKELGHESALVVLDNFEHVLHLKTLLQRLVQQSSALSILVTSRETLGLEGERVMSLEGLAVPPTLGADFDDYGATRLVLELCKAKGVDITAQKQAILELCRAVGGLPLALRLAAPWLNVVSVAELRQQLQRDLEFLNQDSSGSNQRHANIRNMFDVSFHKLRFAEQHELSGLAVFEGKFSFASVNSVLKISLRTLKHFVESSLLRAYPSEGSYELHPLIKTYLRDKLQTDLERWEQLQTNHAAYYLSQLARKDTSQQRETRERLGKEAANVFAAWRYTMNQNDWKTLYELAPSLETFCDETAQQSEGLFLFTQAINAAPTLKGAWLGRMLACCAWLEMRLAQTSSSQRHATEALQLLGTDDTLSRSSCLITLASIYEEAGEFEAARDAFLGELELHPAHSPEAISALMNLATLYLQLGEYRLSWEALAKAEAFSLANDSPMPIRLEFIRSRLLAEQGEFLQARVLLERLSQRAREEKLEHWHKTLGMLLAQVLLGLGELERSAWLAQTLMTEYDKDRWLRAKMQLVLGDVATLRNDTLQALRYYHESLKTVLPTRSVPALLLRLSCLVKGLFSSGQGRLAERIVAYCKDAKNYRRMSFVDRQTLNKFTLSPQAEWTHWRSLEPEEVALLVVSDVDYILQTKNQGEKPPALA